MPILFPKCIHHHDNPQKKSTIQGRLDLVKGNVRDLRHRLDAVKQTRKSIETLTKTMYENVGFDVNYPCDFVEDHIDFDQFDAYYEQETEKNP